MSGLVERIARVAPELPAAQARVARMLADDPGAVAFGTVAAVADAAATSPQTVLRLAARLGHDGFAGLQAEVRDDLLARLPPAAARIRRPPPSDPRDAVRTADRRNLDVSLDVSDERIAAAVELLVAAPSVAVVAADSWSGVGALFADQLAQLRPGVRQLDGPPPAIARELAHAQRGDVLVALDVRRYERWVVDAVGQAAGAGMEVLAVTDGPMSPIIRPARVGFVVGVDSPGPFESATGVVSLLHLLTAETAAATRSTARPRLDRVESAWAALDALIPDS